MIFRFGSLACLGSLFIFIVSHREFASVTGWLVGVLVVLEANALSFSTNTALQVTRIYNVPGHGGEWNASPATGNLSDLSWPSSHHLSATAKYSKRPTDLRSRITYGIRFGGGNFRRCSVCKIEFYRRYAILSLTFSEVGPLGRCLAGIAVIVLEYIHGYLSPPS